MRRAWLLAACLLIPNTAFGSIGTVSSLSGTNAQLERSNSRSALTRTSSIESNDLVQLGSDTNAEIRFVDNTNVKITPNSRLVIDDFVFDPRRSDAGRVGLRVALGSVRYASGQIARNNPQQVAVNTPTATIAVRGTDFSMSVDETGRSMVVMLPSCNSEDRLRNFEIFGNCVTGEITVTSITGGSVVLNQPFTATVVDANQPPTPPVPVPMNLSHIASNDIILRIPASIQSALASREERRSATVQESQDERNVHRDASNRSSVSKAQDLVLASNRTVSELPVSQPTASETRPNTTVNAAPVLTETSNCHPFTECGNLRGTNFYHRVDETRGNMISIRTGERTDNVTYNIGVNSNDVETRVVGNGSSIVTIRQWNR